MRLIAGLLGYLTRGLLLLLLPLVLAILWLLATDSGLRWLMHNSDLWMPEGYQLQAGQVDGTVWEGGLFRQVSYREAGRLISADRLTLDWQPLKLARGIIQIDHVRLEDLRYQELDDGDDQDSGRWRVDDLRLPLALHIDQLRLTHGVVVTGRSGDDIAIASAELTGRWDQQGLLLSPLRLVLADRDGGDAGSARIDASLSLNQLLSWRVMLRAEGVNPAVFSADLSGGIDTRLRLSGQLAATDGPRLALQLQQLQGTLNEHPLSGSGAVSIAAGDSRIDHLQLRSGEAEFSANGSLGTQWDLQWRLNIPRLRQLHDAARGRISGQGRLTGSSDQPGIDGQLMLRELVLPRLHAKRLDADFKLLQHGDSLASIKGQGLKIAGEAISSLSIGLKGLLGKHRLNIDLRHAQGKLALSADGGYQQAQRQWSGRIATLSLRSAPIGDWALNNRADLSIAAEQVELPRLCLSRKLRQSHAKLCAELRWRPDGGRLKAQLSGVSLALLKPMLDGNVEDLSGALTASADIKLGPHPTGKAELNLGSGALSIWLDRYRRLKFKHQGGALKATLDRQQLVASWGLKIGDHSADGDLRIQRPALERDPMKAPIAGRIAFDLKQAGLIDAFFPNIREASGSLQARLKLGGNLTNPGLSGSIKMAANSALLPIAGLKLTDLQLNLHGDGSDTLSIDGGVSSGSGRVEVTGGLTLDPARGWPTKIRLSGSRVRALELPQVTALITPDISIESAHRNIHIGGSVTIPEAQIELRSLPEQAVSASSDVVIVRRDQNGKRRRSTDSQVDASVQVVLGKDISFRGFGLDGRLSGKITVIQRPGRQLSGKGELGVHKATLFFLGERLDVERGRLLYVGGPLNAPGLDVRASREVDDTEVGVVITGTIDDPNFTGFASDPGIRSRDALAMLATGLKPQDAGFDQAVRSTAASIGAMALTNPIAARTGIDQVSFRGGGEGAEDANVYLGKNLSSNLSVGVSVAVKDVSEQSQLVTRYKLRKNLHLEAHSSAEGSGLGLKYTIELK